MTANAEARALLDQLMGVERDALLPAGAALPRKNKRHHHGGTDHNHGGMVLPGVKKSRSCYDRDIDPLFCVWGVDVYELFVNTKSDIGPNPYKVDEAARNEYLSLPKEDRDKLGFDARLFGKLQELVQHCDRTVNRNHEKLKREIQRQSQKRGGNDYVVDVSEEKVEEVVQAECRLEDAKKDLVEALATLKEVQEKEEGIMEEQRKKQTKEQQTNEKDEAESVVEKGKDGDTGEAPAKEGEDESSSTNTSSKIVIDREGTETTPPDFNAGLEELGKLTLQRQNLLCKIATIISQLGPMEENIEVLHAKLNFVRSDTTTDKIVCKVSGNFMSARDADERMAAHYAGKQYVGWKLVRDKYQEMVQKYGRYGPPRPTNRDGGAAPLMPHQKHQMQQGGGVGYGGGGRDRYRGRGGDDRRGGGSSYGGGPRDGGGGRWERGAEGYGGGGYRGGDGRGGHDDRRRGGGGGYGDRDRDRGGYRGGGGSYGGYGRR